MFKIKVIAHSASGKSVLASVTKKIGPFISEVAVGAIRCEDDVPVVGAELELPGVTSATTRQSVAEDGTIFNWLVLS